MRLFLPLPLIGHCCSFFSVCYYITLFVYAYIPNENKFNLINSNTSLKFGFLFIDTYLMSNGKCISSTMKPQFPDLPTLLATFSINPKKFSDFSPCKILMMDPFFNFKISCYSLATNYYFFALGISSFLLLGSWMTVQQNLLIGISSCLKLGVLLTILISTGISFLILISQISPHVMYGSDRCES